jgi:hypothetical protein
MIEAGDGFGFSFKALLANRIIRKLFRKDFDRNRAIQTNVTSAVDFAHPASAEGRTNFIWAEKGTRSESHNESDYNLYNQPLSESNYLKAC